MTERRVSTRIPFRHRVKYGPNNPTFAGYTSNLSDGGVGITINKVFPPKSRVIVQIYLGDESIKLEGMVVWASPVLPGIHSQMGIKFSSRTDEIKGIYQEKLSRIGETTVVSAA